MMILWWWVFQEKIDDNKALRCLFACFFYSMIWYAPYSLLSEQRQGNKQYMQTERSLPRQFFDCLAKQGHWERGMGFKWMKKGLLFCGHTCKLQLLLQLPSVQSLLVFWFYLDHHHDLCRCFIVNRKKKMQQNKIKF